MRVELDNQVSWTPREVPWYRARFCYEFAENTFCVGFFACVYARIFSRNDRAFLEIQFFIGLFVQGISRKSCLGQLVGNTQV